MFTCTFTSINFLFSIIYFGAYLTLCFNSKHFSFRQGSPCSNTSSFLYLSKCSYMFRFTYYMCKYLKTCALGVLNQTLEHTLSETEIDLFLVSFCY